MVCKSRDRISFQVPGRLFLGRIGKLGWGDSPSKAWIPGTASCVISFIANKVKKRASTIPIFKLSLPSASL